MQIDAFLLAIPDFWAQLFINCACISMWKPFSSSWCGRLFYIFTLPAVLLNPLPAPHSNTQTLSTAVFESLGDFTRERTHKFLCSPPDRGALLRHKAVAAPLRSGVCEGHSTFQWLWPLTSSKKDPSLMLWGPDGRNRVSVFVHHPSFK